MFSCHYPDQLCNCFNGNWICYQPYCPPLGLLVTNAEECGGFFACTYPSVDQICTCQSPTELATVPDETIDCTCPTARPTNDALCVPVPDPGCTYDDQTCTCEAGHWRCAQSCSPSPPAEGSPCSSTLNCSYGASLCYCDGNWHCS